MLPPPSTSAPSFGHVMVDVAAERRPPGFCAVQTMSQRSPGPTSTDGAIVRPGTVELLHEDPGLYTACTTPARSSAFDNIRWTG
jgi:hypothetical protein